MVSASEPRANVRYEGGTAANEIMGSTQANFLVATPGHHAKEVAVLLNDAVAGLLAADLEEDNTKEFRSNLARHLGQRWLEHMIEQGSHLDSVVMISKAALEREALVVEDFKKSLQR